jgi:hypothetical protein
MMAGMNPESAVCAVTKHVLKTTPYWELVTCTNCLGRKGTHLDPKWKPKGKSDSEIIAELTAQRDEARKLVRAIVEADAIGSVYHFNCVSDCAEAVKQWEGVDAV